MKPKPVFDGVNPPRAYAPVFWYDGRFGKDFARWALNVIGRYATEVWYDDGDGPLPVVGLAPAHAARAVVFYGRPAVLRFEDREAPVMAGCGEVAGLGCPEDVAYALDPAKWRN